MWRRAGFVAASWLAGASWVLSGDAPLADAAEARNAELVRQLIERGEPVDTAQPDGMTALHWAVHHDDQEMVRRLLEAGTAVTTPNRYGVTALSLACRNGTAPIVRMLLKAGANPNASLAGGETPLMTAARTGSVDCVNALLAAGAPIDATERRGQTALMWAAAEGHAAVVKGLLDAGADPARSLPSGFTPLFFAAREGHLDVTTCLLGAGVDVNAVIPEGKGGGKRPRSGSSPLILAVENAHFELALALVRAGADPNDERSGFTPLHTVTWVRKTGFGDNEAGNPAPPGSGSVDSHEFVRELVSLGANVNARLKRGMGGGGHMLTTGGTTFLAAAKNGDLELLRLLHELGADPFQPDARGCTPLLAAAGVGTHAPGEEPASEEEAMATVEWLLGLGAKINHVDQNGETAMHGAAYASFPRMVRFLDAHGADIAVWNRKNRRGWTPLLIAQGFRPGNFKPAEDTIAAIAEVMTAKGINPPPPPERDNTVRPYRP